MNERQGSRRLLGRLVGREEEKNIVIAKRGYELDGDVFCLRLVGLCQDAKFALTRL